MKTTPGGQMPFRTKSWHIVSLVLLAILFYQPISNAQIGPQPPCGSDPNPSYPNLSESAVVKAWHKSELGDNWKPPACTDWRSAGFTTLVTVAARFPYSLDAKDLLRRIGAISQLAAVRYWSTTHKQWRALILEAHALTGVQPGQRREDLSPDEMIEGKVFYFEQEDNLSGKGIYRMHIAAASPNRLVIDFENVSTIHYLLVPLFRPGEVQSMYFLDRESPDVWRFYSIVRTRTTMNQLLTGNESSAINRAVAFYRYLVGIPTDQEPPAAR
jgi:hypothetical protein